ncbi:MAG: cyclic nucleotide-binding/CBS domain-containing protein [Candidatus Hodarchaeota archaeon]
MISNEEEVLIGELVKKRPKGIISMLINQPVTEAAKLMAENQVGSIIITNGNINKIEGIITKGDVINRVVGRALDPGIIMVEDVMSKPVVFVSADETVENTMLIMGRENIERILVVEDNELTKPLGIISTNDILKFAPGLLRIHRERLLIKSIVDEVPKEENRSLVKFEGFCDDCNNYSDSLRTANGYTLCPACIDTQLEEDSSSDDDIM